MLVNEEGKNFDAKTWFFGLLTGIGVAAPITAYFVKKVYDKKSPVESSGTPKMGLLEPPRGISEGHIPTAEEINNYDLSIDDEEATEASQIPAEDQERFRDMLERYNGELADTAFVISQETFMNDQTNEKAYINWYEGDNKFEEDLIPTQDPLASFGVANGNDIFNEANAKLSGDPDIVYVRNNKQTTDYEITRIHDSYKNAVEGTSGIGQADSDM